MKTAQVINGHLASPSRIDLDEPVEHLSGDVEVIVRPRPPQLKGELTLAQVLEQMPPGTRTKEEIDEQLRQERDAWER